MMKATASIVPAAASAAVICASELLLTGISHSTAGRVGLASVAFAGSWASLLLSSLAYGFLLSWLLATLRPTLGTGWRTVGMASGTLWLAGYTLPTLGVMTMTFFGPRSTLALPDADSASGALLGLAWGAAELVLAATAAGYTSRRVVAGSPGGTTGPGA